MWVFFLFLLEGINKKQMCLLVVCLDCVHVLRFERLSKETLENIQGSAINYLVKFGIVFIWL